MLSNIAKLRKLLHDRDDANEALQEQTMSLQLDAEQRAGDLEEPSSLDGMASLDLLTRRHGKI